MRCAARLNPLLALGVSWLALGCGYYSQGEEVPAPRQTQLPAAEERDGEISMPQASNAIPESQPATVSTEPAWVSQGCQSFWPAENSDPVICGIGMARGSKNTELLQTTAISRGRAEIAQTLGAGVRAMLNDYASSAAGEREFGDPSEYESYLETLSERITQRSVAGARTEDGWSSRDQTRYALVSLDSNAFVDALNGMDQLSVSMRTALTEAAEIWFSRMGRASRRVSTR